MYISIIYSGSGGEGKQTFCFVFKLVMYTLSSTHELESFRELHKCFSGKDLTVFLLHGKQNSYGSVTFRLHFYWSG